ncbi:MAG: DUF2130 domain-containing protein [Deltaproteobacteria bacterium]|nr:DUF2130 domain-containing protein [Deltaproteobacteria bacterium]
MGEITQYQCPLCNSRISREVYDRVLRIDEARRQEAARERARIQRALEQVERQREQIASRAAQAERKRLEALAAKAQKRLTEQIRELQGQAEAERRRHEHAMAVQAGAAKRESTEKERHLLRQIEQAKKSAEAERRRAERDTDARVRAAKEEAEQPHRLRLEKLNGQLRTLEERRHREVESLNRAIAALKEKADARDHAHFGPEGEDQLVEALKREFPRDGVEHRGKGGDVIHTVFDGGRPLGKIVYECKRTATWQSAFARQLKKAMEEHETKYGLLVSRKFPRNRSGFCTANGVLVVEPHLAVQVASVLRDAIIALGRARMSETGKAAKTEEIYRYLRSDDFSNAISRIDDKIKELRASLEKEKSGHDGWWRTREQSYGTILREASGIDGRVQEILTGRTRLIVAPTQRGQAAATPSS